MNRNFLFSLAIGAFSFTTAAVAQQPAAVDPSRTDSVVQQALRSYQTGLDAMRPVETAQPGTSSGNFREIRLEEAVSLALEKNLDIQVWVKPNADVWTTFCFALPVSAGK